jgi:hypothetical protein
MEIDVEIVVTLVNVQDTPSNKTVIINTVHIPTVVHPSVHLYQVPKKRIKAHKETAPPAEEKPGGLVTAHKSNQVVNPRIESTIAVVANVSKSARKKDESTVELNQEGTGEDAIETDLDEENATHVENEEARRQAVDDARVIEEREEKEKRFQEDERVRALTGKGEAAKEVSKAKRGGHNSTTQLKINTPTRRADARRKCLRLQKQKDQKVMSLNLV